MLQVFFISMCVKTSLHWRPLNRHRWLWRRRKISSPAIITFPARKAECALLLCVLILDEKCFQWERGVHSSAWRKILMRLFAAVICLRRTDGRRRLLFFIMHTWEIAAGAECGNNDVAAFVDGAPTTQFDIACQLPSIFIHAAWISWQWQTNLLSYIESQYLFNFLR